MLSPSRSQVFATVATVASVALSTPAFAQGGSGPLPTIRPGACVERMQTDTGGDGGLRAHFWYERFGDAPAVLDIPRGPDNEVTPVDTQTLHKVPVPEHFEAVTMWAFDATLGAEPITWTLRDPSSGEGGSLTVGADYASRCVRSTLTTVPDPDKEYPPGSSIRVAWTAKVSGVEEFLEAGAPDVPWSAWRESCTIDGAAIPCEESDVVLENLAAGPHVFRVFAQAPLPADIGPAAGTKENPYAFTREVPFTIARASSPAAEPARPAEPAAPIQPAAPIMPAAPIQPVTPAQPATPVSTKPACAKRTLTITVPKRGGKHARSAKVTVDGKRVRVLKRTGRFVAIVPAAEIKRETVRVKITARYAGGKKKTFSKTLRTCA